MKNKTRKFSTANYLKESLTGNHNLKIFLTEICDSYTLYFTEDHNFSPK